MSQTVPITVEQSRHIYIRSGSTTLDGDLIIPEGAEGIVLFAHGSGSSRHSPRNQFVAQTIRQSGVGTLLFDLLTRKEETIDARTGQLRFDIELLANRLIDATYWVMSKLESMRVGYFGSSTGGGAALVAAAELGNEIGAVVTRGGRPDLAGEALPKVKCPTLLIVGGLDYPVIEMNEDALRQMKCKRELKIVPGASHLFEERGALENVAHLAAQWFQDHLNTNGPARRTE